MKIGYRSTLRICITLHLHHTLDLISFDFLYFMLPHKKIDSERQSVSVIPFDSILDADFKTTTDTMELKGTKKKKDTSHSQKTSRKGMERTRKNLYETPASCKKRKLKKDIKKSR